jgi:hypothetical protein
MLSSQGTDDLNQYDWKQIGTGAIVGSASGVVIGFICGVVRNQKLKKYASRHK